MADALAVAVTIRAIDALTRPTRAMAAQMQRLRQQTNMTEEQLSRLESRMKKFKNMTLVGAGVTLAGVGLAKGLADAADAAGRLQTKMLNVQSALKLTNSELKKATNLSMTVGIPTMWSSEQMSEIMQTMANSGLSKSQVLNPDMLKAYSSFAEVQYRKNGTDPNDSVAAAVGMAHQYQMYSTKQINPFLNSLNAALLHTNSTPSEFATTFKYISQQARNMGMNANQSLATTAWLDRMGFGNGRGGTNFADFLQRSIYGSSGNKADAAMVQAGFVKNGHSVFENNKGQFVGIQKASQILQDFSKRFGNDANKTSPLLHEIFGTQGGRIAQMMMSKGASEQYTNVQKQMGNTSSIKATQEKLNQSWEGQTTQLKTTLKDIQQVFGQSLMGLFLGPLKGLNQFLSKVLELAQAHKKIVAYVATFAAIAAAILLVVGPLMLLTGAFGFLKESGMIAAGIRAIGTAFTGMLGPLATVVAASYLIYQAWTHDWGGIQEKTKAVLGWLKKEFDSLKGIVDPVLKALGIETVTKNTKVMHGALSAPQTVKSFKVPSWAKWGAGILVASKGLSGLIGMVNKFISISKALKLTNLIKGFSSLSKAMMGSNTLKAAKSTWNFAKWFGPKSLSAVKTIGSAIATLSKNTLTAAASFAKLSGQVLLTTAKFIANATATLAVRTAQIVAAAATKVWRAVQISFNAVMDANPIALIIIAIAALIAIIILMITHWKQVITVVKKVWGWMKDFGSDVAKVFTGLWHDAASWGANIIKGLWQGISNFGGWLTSKIGSFVSNHITGPFKRLLGIHSPSTVFAQHGMYIVQGLAQGINQHSGLAQKSSSELAKAVMNPFSGGSLNASTSSRNTTVHIHEGAIQVNGSKNSKQTAKEIINQLGNVTRTNNKSRSLAPNSLIYNGG